METGRLVMLLLSRVLHFVNPWTAAHQASIFFTISWSLPKLMPIESPSHPLSPPSPPALNLSQNQEIFQWVSFWHQVAKVLELQFQHQPFWWIFRFDFLSEWLVWSPHCPRGSQKSSPTPQLKSISSLVLSLLYGPTLISVHDCWKNYSFDYTALCLLWACYNNPGAFTAAQLEVMAVEMVRYRGLTRSLIYIKGRNWQDTLVNWLWNVRAIREDFTVLGLSTWYSCHLLKQGRLGGIAAWRLRVHLWT